MPKRDSPDFDRLYKVCPLLDSVATKCRELEQEEHQSLDETIIPTKSRTSLKQYLPKKPHKWGIKSWTRAGVSGIVYDFDIYQGKTQTMDGKIDNVVERLTSKISSGKHYKLYMDNYFVTLSNVMALRSRQIWVTGTVRCNRLKGAGDLLMGKKEMERLGRGSSDSVVDANSALCVVRWYDNGIVTLLSTCHDAESHEEVKRWSLSEKKHIDIPIPGMVKEYNANMGGVDLRDMLTALYRIQV